MYKSKAALLTELFSTITDQKQQQNTSVRIRAFLQDLIDSTLDLTGATASISASNGLSTNGLGNVYLGGNLTGATTIGGNYTLLLNRLLSFHSNSDTNLIEDISTNNQLFVTNNKILSSVAGLGEFELNSSSGKIKWTDQRSGSGATGIEYDADYSANYVNRSLVDFGTMKALLAMVSGSAINLATQQVAFGSNSNSISGTTNLMFRENPVGQNQLWIGQGSGSGSIDLGSSRIESINDLYLNSANNGVSKIFMRPAQFETMRLVVNGTSFHTLADATAYVDIKGSTANISSLRIQSGITTSAITSPLNGHVINDGSHIYSYLDGNWKQLDNDSGAGVFLPTNNVAYGNSSSGITSTTAFTYNPSTLIIKVPAIDLVGNNTNLSLTSRGEANFLGIVNISNLGGGGTRMVVADNFGNIGAQNIPTSLPGQPSNQIVVGSGGNSIASFFDFTFDGSNLQLGSRPSYYALNVNISRGVEVGNFNYILKQDGSSGLFISQYENLQSPFLPVLGGGSAEIVSDNSVGMMLGTLTNTPLLIYSNSTPRLGILENGDIKIYSLSGSDRILSITSDGRLTTTTTAATISLISASSISAASYFSGSTPLTNIISTIATTIVTASTISAITYSSGLTVGSLTLVNGTGGTIFTPINSSLKTKSHFAPFTAFTGVELLYPVTFFTPMPSALYSISILGEDVRSWSYSSRTASGFTIMSNSTTPLTANVQWVATMHGEN